MSSILLAQIACEGTLCTARYPEQPATYDLTTETAMAAGRPSTVKGFRALRMLATSVGWETKRQSQGRDLCPSCRITEIRKLSAADSAEGERP